MKDSQRQKVYDAEQAAFYCSEAAHDTSGYVFTSEAEIEKFLKALWKQEYFKKHFGTDKKRLPTVRITYGREGAAYASSWEWKMHFHSRKPSGAKIKKWVVIHELAHLLDDHFDKVKGWKGDRRGHGRKFTATYLDLVRRTIGKDAHDRLKEEFKKKGAKYSAPRAKRVLTEAQKEELRDRVAVARAVKEAKKDIRPCSKCGFETYKDDLVNEICHYCRSV